MKLDAFRILAIQRECLRLVPGHLDDVGHGPKSRKDLKSVHLAMSR
jgi:hypothetical protein